MRPVASAAFAGRLCGADQHRVAATRKLDREAHKTVVQRAITFGRTLCQAKEKIGHGKWEKWLNDNCRNISAIKKDPKPSEEYDRAESALVKKLEALSPDTAEAAANDTFVRLNEAIARIKTKAA